MPRVNLMPPEIAEAERFRRLQLAMGGAVLASVVIVGLLYHHEKSGISSAQGQLDAAQAKQTALQSQLNGLSNVSQTYADVQAKQALLSQAMGQEIRWSYILNDLSYRITSNLWLTNVSATETSVGGPTTTAPTGLPGGPSTSLGTVSFSGVAFSHDDVAKWLDSLTKEKGFSQPTFSSSTEVPLDGRMVVNYGTQVLVNENALSNRYVQGPGN
jgi:Tfp pilus assembly protein PilN